MMKDAQRKEIYLQRLVKFWVESTDTIRFDTFRLCIGLALLLYMGFRWQYSGEWLTSAGYHLSQENLPYHNFWVPLLPEPWLPWFGIFFFGSILGFTLGWQTQWCSWIILVCLIYVTSADQLAAFSPNKLLILIMSVFACATHGAHWSLCRGNTFKHSVWPVRILQIMIIIHLFTAGSTKVVFGEWLSNPYVLWTQMQGTYRTDFAAFLLNVLPPKFWAFLQINTLLFELFCPILFIQKRFRWIAFLWGGTFQLMIALTMHSLIYFNLIILSFFVLFMDTNTLYKIKSVFTFKGFARG